MSTSTPDESPSDPELEMKIDINVLDHLGLKMYTNMPAVISEYVANSWDAWATEVDIQVPEGPINDETGRHEILQIHTRGMPLAEDIDLAALAADTHTGLSVQISSH